MSRSRESDASAVQPYVPLSPLRRFVGCRMQLCQVSLQPLRWCSLHPHFI